MWTALIYENIEDKIKYETVSLYQIKLHMVAIDIQQQTFQHEQAQDELWKRPLILS